jgi:hypothetical protein
LNAINNISSHHLIIQSSFFIASRFFPLVILSISGFYRLTCVLQMGKKRGGLPLRKELDNLQYLQSHPEIHQYFSDAGCLTYVEKLQEGYHQGITEAFAKSYDGNKATIGPLEIQVDEAAIASATGMPRTGKNGSRPQSLRIWILDLI